jgi:putative endonuclease
MEMINDKTGQFNSRTAGKAGEARACMFLEEQGFKILETNFYAGRYGEIDIVALKDKLLVFAEVKSRSNEKYGGGIYSITEKKKKSLRRAAGFYLVKNSIYDSKDYTIRFDLILVENGEITLVDDILR